MASVEKIDAVIVGAGVVGAAVAQSLSIRGLQCWILDRRDRMGGETTERNSGVIHAGLYYPSNSLKTQLCIEGKRLLYEWAQRYQVPYRRCGKIILARTQGEEAALAARLAHAQKVGVSELSYLTKAQLLQETGIAHAPAALLSESTGIVDPVELTRSLIATAPDLELVLNTEVRAIEKNGDGFELATNRGPVRATIVINAAGLYADKIANLLSPNKYRIYPCRGNYFSWRTKRQITRLIYPVKQKNAAGLGIHLTVGLDGSLKWGPDAEFVEELDYRPAEDKRAVFVDAVRRLYPDIQADDLSYESCGIRPKLRAPSESEEKDFIIEQDLEGFVNLVGIESPGLTASLAIAKYVTHMLGL